MSITKGGLSSFSLGLTFIEMLVALAINTVLLLAITSIFSTHVSYFSTTMDSDMLEQQLQMAIDQMTNDIRRAGYWANAYTDVNSSGTTSNPFVVTGSTDVTITGGNCILFTYDHAKNGVLPSISATSDDDRYGYRLINQTLQTRPPGATFACNAAATNWENVTNPTVVQITAINFILNEQTAPAGSPSAYMAVRSVSISITGQLTADTTITKTLKQIVKIRNDKYI